MILHIVAVSAIVIAADSAERSRFHRSWDDVRNVRIVTTACGVNGNGELSQLHAELRVSADGMLYIEDAHGGESEWPFDIGRRRLYLRDRIVTDEVPYRRVVVKYPVEQLRPDQIENHAIWAVLGWWPEDFPIKPPLVYDSSIQLCASLLDVCNDIEIDQAHDKVIVRAPQETIELSISHGLAISKRAWYSRTDGKPKTTMIVNDFFEIAPEVWCPLAFEVWRHDPRNAAEVRKVAYQITEASVNALSAADFTFTPSAGTYQVDSDGKGGGAQIAPGGFELMLSYVRLLRRDIPVNQGSVLPIVLGCCVGVALYAITQNGNGRKVK